MTYQVLARKWRPHTFADVVGQQHVLKALSHSLDNQRLHHAYLFAGTRGVGKTTLGRIMARALNCERGVSATPCGECSACNEINEGRFVDLIEVDAASRTKVEDTRELLENVQYAPSRGRYKVYLIDEVHMLSASSFNALLKTLEEPPPHVIFLLATTDPQKLPVTVLSRCLQFNLKRLTLDLIGGRLREICDAEGIEADDGALALLAQSADGSLRDALSMMDQAVAFGGGKLPEADVREMLGALDSRFVFALLQHIAANDGPAVLAEIAAADEQFPDYKRLLDELAGLLQRIAVHQAVGANDLEADDARFVKDMAASVSAQDIQLFYQIAIIGKRDLVLAPDPRAGVEMVLLRMLAFRPAAIGSAQGAGGSSTASLTGDGKSGAQAARQAALAVKKTNDNALKQSANKSENATQTKAPSTADAPAAKAQPPASDVPTEGGLENWHRLIGQLPLGGVARLLAANCAFVAREGKKVKLTLDKRSESLLTEPRRTELAEVLSKHLGEEITLQVSIDGVVQKETPVQRAERKQEQRSTDAKAELASDAGVQVMQQLFDAELQTDSVQVVE